MPKPRKLKVKESFNFQKATNYIVEVLNRNLKLETIPISVNEKLSNRGGVVWMPSQDPGNGSKNNMRLENYNVIAPLEETKQVGNYTLRALSLQFILHQNDSKGPVMADETHRFDQALATNLFASKNVYLDYYLSRAKKLIPSNDMKNVYADYSWTAYALDGDIETLYCHFDRFDCWVAIREAVLGENTKGLCFISHKEVGVAILAEFYSHNIDMWSQGNDSSLITHEDIEKDFDIFNNEEVSDLFYDALETFREEQSDPFLGEEDLQESELTFLSGSKEELEEGLKLLCHAAIPLHIWQSTDSDELVLNIRSSTDDGDEAHLDEDSLSYNNNWKEILDSMPANFESTFEYVVAKIVDDNQPAGHSWEYNDGAYDRRSGYDMNPLSVEITIPAPSAHEQLCAKLELNKWVSRIGKTYVDEILNYSNEIKA